MNKNAYIKRKIRKLIKEGMSQKQAIAVANSYWDKRILVARNIDISGITSGVAMKYKIETFNQSAGSKETRIHATSLAWA